MRSWSFVETLNRVYVKTSLIVQLPLCVNESIAIQFSAKSHERSHRNAHKRKSRGSRRKKGLAAEKIKRDPTVSRRSAGYREAGEFTPSCPRPRQWRYAATRVATPLPSKPPALNLSPSLSFSPRVVTPLLYLHPQRNESSLSNSTAFYGAPRRGDFPPT